MSDVLLRVNNLTKTFGNVKVLNNVSFDLKRGEIVGLVGANGSGKTTLLNILFGNRIIQETGGYTGEIIIDGKNVKIKSVLDSIKNGIGMIHQEFALFSNMTVSQNICINRENTKFTLFNELAYIDNRKNDEKSKEIIRRLGIDVDINLRVIDLSVNIKQFVEIARAINMQNIKILLLDEPTAVLNEYDSKKIMDIVKEIASTGTGVIFISHRLEEIVEICDRVIVLKDGSIEAFYDKKCYDIEKIAIDMIGQKTERIHKGKVKKKDNVVMEIKNFTVNMIGEMLKELNLEIYKGEILGLAGLSGHGKLALAYGIMGIYNSTGLVKVNGKEIKDLNPINAIKNGINFICDERRNRGLLLNESVLENIIFSKVQINNCFLSNNLFKSLSFINKKDAVNYANECVKKYDIKCTSINQKVIELSGGNQQKVCIARILGLEPDILFISEPTRGIDVGAKENILDIIINLNKEKNTTIIIASSELDELKRVCDRIAVFYEGRLVDILPPDAENSDFALAFSGEKRC